MTHFRLLSPNLRCHLQVPAAKAADAEELFDELPVDEVLGCLLKEGRLRLRWPLKPLRPLSFLCPPRLTKLTSASSSSLKAAVRGAGAGVAVADAVDEELEEEAEEETLLIGVAAFSAGRP